MNPFGELLGLVHEAVAAVQADGGLPAALELERVAVDPPRDASHGEAATNAALVLAKARAQAAHGIGERAGGGVGGRGRDRARPIAHPGFINLTMRPAFWQRRVHAVLAAGPDYGRSEIGSGRRVNVEFCSANPTGPLHVGHGRGTVFGDALAAVLGHAGFAVTREYYLNDGGAQTETLARSLHLRYREALGEADRDSVRPLPRRLPEASCGRDSGQGRRPVAGRWRVRVAGTVHQHGHRRDAGADPRRSRGAGCGHDVFTSERRLIGDGRIDEALAVLGGMGLLYTGTLPPPKGGKPDADWEPVPQLLFRSTEYGDEIDRPLKRSNGAWTYFAADIAYHLDKFRRGFPAMVDVWGADHAGYIKRMQAAVRAVTAGEGALDVRVCQLVNLLDAGTPMKMSKRAGRIVTLRDVVDEVGRDVVRFIMRTRKNDAAGLRSRQGHRAVEG